MIVTSKFKIDLADDRADAVKNAVPILTVQGDTDTHAVEISLFEYGKAWAVPEGATAVVGYAKSNGVKGSYDTLEDGTPACTISENVVTAVISGRVLTEPGPVHMTVFLLHGGEKLNIFEKIFWVRRDPVEDAVDEEDYVNWYQWLSSLSPELVQELGDGEKAVMSQKAVTDALSAVVQHTPEFANSISECTDTTKLYVLPDGMLYAYMKNSASSFTNLADPNSSEWANDSRLNSSASVVTYTGAVVTNYIPVSAGDVVRIKGLNILHSTAGYLGPYTDKAGVVKCTSFTDHFTVDEDGTIAYEIYTIAPDVQDSVVKIRFSGVLTAESPTDIIITINEELVYGEGYGWKSTGHAYQPADYEGRIIELESKSQAHAADIEALDLRLEALENENISAELPQYWQDHLSEKIASIQALQQAGGKDCFTFPLMTDLHINYNLGKRSGVLARAVMDACDAPYALCLGDVVTRGADTTAASMDGRFTAAEALLAPVRDRLLQTQGNHDGSWGAEDLDGDGDVEGTEFYCHNFTPQKLHSLIYRKVGLVGDAHFDTSGSGYFMDDVSNKVRYILLNSHNNAYEENADGTAKYNNMRIFRFGQSQFDLLVEALTSVPGEDWAVLTASHAPINDAYAALFGGNNGEQVLLRGLLRAYQEKTAFEGSFAGTYGSDAVTVQADFSGAKGQYIAHFAGHCHTDTVESCDGVMVITTRCDAKEENDQTLNAERVAGTITEQSFDVFTVNKVSGQVFATKIGAGQDRVIDTK